MATRCDRIASDNADNRDLVAMCPLQNRITSKQTGPGTHLSLQITANCN